MASSKLDDISKETQKKQKKEFNLEELKAYKTNPVKDVLHKFKYSFQGFGYCFKNETSFTFEAISIVAAIIAGFAFDIKPHYWVFSLISLFLIIEIEFLNTAIEATVDMVTQKYHPLAKIAKDCGSAATCMATLIAVIVHLYIYGYVYILPMIFK